MGTLRVNVHASHIHDTNQQDNDMLLVAEVIDADGSPVTDLQQENFEVRQLGMGGFGRIRTILIQNLGNTDDALAGVYHLIPRWNWYVESQFVFAVIVDQGEDGDSGRGLATLVTQGSQS